MKWEKAIEMSNTDFRCYCADISDYLDGEFTEDIANRVLNEIKFKGIEVNDDNIRKITIENAKKTILPYLEEEYESMLRENDADDICIYDEDGEPYECGLPSNFAHYVFTEIKDELIENITKEVMNTINGIDDDDDDEDEEIEVQAP